MRLEDRLSRSFTTSAFFILKPATYYPFSLLFVLLITSCGSSKKVRDEKMQLTYLDDKVIEPSNDALHFGGISGLDYQNDTLFMVSDSGKYPSIFATEIHFNQQKISLQSSEIYLKLQAPKDGYFDLESIHKLNAPNAFLLSNEGHIKRKIAPQILKVDKTGNIIKNYQLPDDYLFKNNRSAVIHNRAIEAVSLNMDKTGCWFSTEFPLTSEGKPPKLFKSGASQEFLFLDFGKDQITAQFKYQLDPIPKLPLLPYSLNGLTGMQVISPTQMITIERGFSAGWGKHSNRVKLFLVESQKELTQADQNSPQKRLLLDLKHLKKQLKADRIDNIEGICLGPELADGSKTILLISDDNFDAYNDQITQLIWLKINR